MENIVVLLIGVGVGATIGIVVGSILDRCDVLYVCPRCRWRRGDKVKDEVADIPMIKKS